MGLKAVEYAQWLNALLAGSAGRPHKHAQLRVLGAAGLCSSRSGGAFATGSMWLLAGGRHHAALNSLSLDWIAASFALLGEGGALNTSRLISSDETRYTVMLSVAVMLEVRAISDSTPYLHKYDVATFETSTSALGSGTGSASVLPLAVTTDTIVDEG